MFIGIKDGKIWDICSSLESKRTDFNLPDSDYFITDKQDIRIGDTWDLKKKDSLRDSPKRFEERPKSKLQLLQNKIIELESRLETLENK